MLLRGGEFPRFPLTRNHNIFARLSELGEKLINLHVDTPALESMNGFSCNVERNDIILPKYPQYDGQGILFAPGKGIYPVSAQIWEFKVGKYRVCQHWIASRVGESLTDEDLHDFQVIVRKIEKTLDLMEKIDNILQESGVFDAFIAGEP